jgi:hypothetical protein
MTPTEEEAELARVIAPGYFDGRPEGEQVRADALELANAILAAGWAKRSDVRSETLEEAAKACDGLFHEAAGNKSAESTNYDFWQGAQVGAEESAARIRSLKDRT